MLKTLYKHFAICFGTICFLISLVFLVTGQTILFGIQGLLASWVISILYAIALSSNEQRSRDASDEPDTVRGSSLFIGSLIGGFSLCLAGAVVWLIYWGVR